MRKKKGVANLTNTYKNYKDNRPELTLNDYLALDRTTLSVERTHLSYMRTVVSMVVAAITIYKILGGIEGSICAIILGLSAIYFYIRGKKICKEISSHIQYIEDEDD